jgi:inhibitor of KinA
VPDIYDSELARKSVYHVSYTLLIFKVLTMENTSPYRIFPLGDTAITVDFGETIDEEINRKVLSLYHHLQAYPLYGMVETVPAYSSLTVYYDFTSTRKKISNGQTVYDYVKNQLQERLQQSLPVPDITPRMMSIPVCYDADFGPDLEKLAREENLTTEEIIRIHCEKQYRVYMLGFLPGFTYMGEVDERISVARKSQPDNVAPGSVGIAGRQTGIYPQASPGGWQIIGRTPLKLFDRDKEEPVLLKAGDYVQFIPISKHEFANY